MSKKKSKEEIGRESSITGFAHEHIVVGLLMKKYHNVSLVDLPLSPYDIIIVNQTEKGEDIIRAQVKTSPNSVKFTGGTRGGVDREYKSGVKEYTQSTLTSDVVIGVKDNSNFSFDLYFVPTFLIEELGQKSISLKRINALKNNYFILENCKNKSVVINFCKENSIL